MWGSHFLLLFAAGASLALGGSLRGGDGGGGVHLDGLGECTPSHMAAIVK